MRDVTGSRASTMRLVFVMAFVKTSDFGDAPPFDNFSLLKSGDSKRGEIPWCFMHINITHKW